MAMPTAARRWWGVTSCADAPSACSFDVGLEDELDANSEVGRAMSTTPARLMPAPIRSTRVNGSLSSLLQAQQARVGARKVRTVASARGKYWRDQ